MDDQYKPSESDWSRQYYDPSHPLYVSSAAEDGLVRQRYGRTTDLGPGQARALCGFRACRRVLADLIAMRLMSPTGTPSATEIIVYDHGPAGFGSCSMWR